MRRVLKLRIAPLLTLVVLAGCVDESRSSSTEDDVVLPPCTGGVCVVAPIPKADACPGNRQIGFLPVGVPMCPDATPTVGGAWSKANLFGVGRPPELAGYCRYDWTGTVPPDLAALPTAGLATPFDWLDPDCHVVVPIGAGHPYETAAASALESAFLQQVEALQVMPGDGHAEATKVVVVDASETTAFPDPGMGLIDHGMLVGLIIRRLGCPTSAKCLTQVSNRLALGLREGSSGPEYFASGGSFGYQSDLAVAILDGYEAAAAASASRRIIMNLSVGWDPATGGGQYTGAAWDTLDAPARAVHSAITKVACEGALVIAAAGNDAGGPTSSGPMYPGGWETKAAPSSSRCVPLGGGAAPLGSTYRPLVYAIGGVDGRDEPVSVGRVGGVPSLVTAADHVLMGYSSAATPTWTGAHTGTSIGAAVASGIAGAVWAYLPSITAHDVMSRVQGAGVSLPRPADFCLAGTSCPLMQSRLSLCRSIAAVCGPSAHCSTAPTCPTPVPGRDERPTGLNLGTITTTTTIDGSAAIHRMSPGAPCSGAFLALESTGAGSGVYCPQRQLYSNESVPWVYPQPGTWVCPTCSWTFGALYLGISRDAPKYLSEPRLVFVDAYDNIETIELDLGSTLGPGATIKVTDLDISEEEFAGLKKATFDVVVNGKHTNSSPLLLDP